MVLKQKIRIPFPIFAVESLTAKLVCTTLKFFVQCAFYVQKVINRSQCVRAAWSVKLGTK